MRILIRIVLGLLLFAALAIGGLFALYENNKVAIPDLAHATNVDSRVAENASKATVARAAERLDQLRREIGYPAVSIAVAVDGVIVWQEAHGCGHRSEAEAPSRLDTPFAIGSVSKPLTAAVAMRLAERGVLDLDADIRKYLPAYPQKEFVITPRQLLSHQAGIRHYNFALTPPTFSENGSTTQYDRVADSLAVFANDPLLFKPDTNFSYSSYGFVLLSAVMESAAGKPFLELMQSELFAPLALANTGADDKTQPGRRPRSRLPKLHARWRRRSRAICELKRQMGRRRLPRNPDRLGAFRGSPTERPSGRQGHVEDDVHATHACERQSEPARLRARRSRGPNHGQGFPRQVLACRPPWRRRYRFAGDAGHAARPKHRRGFECECDDPAPGRGMFDTATSIAVLFAETR